MRATRDRFVGLCLPPIAFAILDATLTLYGQSSDYWSGRYAAVNEASPTFHQLLAIHPVVFVAGFAVWMAIFVGFILLVSDTWALISCITVINGHAAGAATWLLWRFQFGYQAANGCFFWRRSWRFGDPLGMASRPESSVVAPRTVSARDRVLAALLFAAAVWLFLCRDPRETFFVKGNLRRRYFAPACVRSCKKIRHESLVQPHSRQPPLGRRSHARRSPRRS